MKWFVRYIRLPGAHGLNNLATASKLCIFSSIRAVTNYKSMLADRDREKINFKQEII